MRLQQLYYLLVLYQSDTMVDAANKCYVTQPTISKAIKSLEEELGIEILLRGNQRRVAFTEEGEDLAETAKSIIFELETIRSTFSKKKGQSASGLRPAFCPCCQCLFRPHYQISGYGL